MKSLKKLDSAWPKQRPSLLHDNNKRKRLLSNLLKTQKKNRFKRHLQ